MDDMIAWHYNKNGMFSVRSSYKVHVADRERCNAARSGGSSSFTRNNDDQLWKQLWQVDCPKKMLHFMWRVSHNNLALHVNLKLKGIKLNTGCVLCGRLEEDGAHLFFKCKHVKRVWDDLQLQEVRNRPAQAISAKELVWEILKLKKNVQRRVITLIYIWWSERCRIHEGDAPRGLG
jgi:hypothetical protein